MPGRAGSADPDLGIDAARTPFDPRVTGSVSNANWVRITRPGPAARRRGGLVAPGAARARPSRCRGVLRVPGDRTPPCAVLLRAGRCGCTLERVGYGPSGSAGSPPTANTCSRRADAPAERPRNSSSWPCDAQPARRDVRDRDEARVLARPCGRRDPHLEVLVAEERHVDLRPRGNRSARLLQTRDILARHLQREALDQNRAAAVLLLAGAMDATCGILPVDRGALPAALRPRPRQWPIGMLASSQFVGVPLGGIPLSRPPATGLGWDRCTAWRGGLLGQRGVVRDHAAERLVRPGGHERRLEDDAEDTATLALSRRDAPSAAATLLFCTHAIAASCASSPRPARRAA